MNKYKLFIICLVFLLAASLQGTYDVKAASSYSATILNGPLNIRSDADGKSEVIGKVNKGAQVTVTKEAHGWLKITTTDKVSGWVAGYYVGKSSGTASTKLSADTTTKSDTPTKAVSTSSATLGTVTTDSLRIRAGAGTKFDVVGGLVKGEEVAIKGKQGDWLQISSGGIEGWVAAEYVKDSGKAITAATVKIASAGTSSGGLSGKTIVIDPGHGGVDPGTIGFNLGVKEKDVNFSTSRYLVSELKNRGAKVVLTRNDDTKIALAERVAISKAAGANAFVSVHYNSTEDNTKASGTLIYYNSSNRDEPLARAVEKQIKGASTGIKYNGLAYGDLHVLRENNVPSILLELGFLSNKSDEAVANTKEYQQKVAVLIASGIENYFK